MSTPDTPLRLVAYCRTSSKNGIGGDSLQAQADACREWADANGHDVVLVYRDDALSGALGIEDRPGLTAALVALDDGLADGLIVHRPDRLARELHVQEVALAHAWAAGSHVRVFEAAEGAEIVRDDPRDPQRRFLRQVMGAAAELERGLIKARLQRGRSRKHQAGGYAGGPLVGYGEIVVGQGKHAVRRPDPACAATVALMTRLRAEGTPFAAIADELNRDGIPTARGGRWHAMTVKLITDRMAVAA